MLVGAIVLVSLAPCILAANLAARRMIQYDAAEDHYGSQRSIFNAEVVTAQAVNVARKCVIVNADEFSAKLLHDLDDKNALGIVVILPDLSIISLEQKKKFQVEEAEVLQLAFTAPVYFVQESPEIRSLYNGISKSSSNSGSLVDAFFQSRHHVEAQTQEPYKLSNIPMTNLQLLLRGKSKDSSSSRRAVMVVAHYDSFGLVPSLSRGADANGSGAAVLLELARLFSAVYASEHSRPQHDIIFLLTAGGKLNYHGAQHWIDQADAKLLESIDAALCLDSIGLSQDSLHLHLSKLPSNDTRAFDLIQAVSTSAANAGIRLHKSPAKINKASSLRSFEHEVLRLGGVFAATLSGTEKADDSHLFAHSSILDTSIEYATLKRNAVVLADAIAAYLFPSTGTRQLQFTESDINNEFLGSWMQYFSERPRTPYHTRLTNDDFVAAVTQTFKTKYTADVSSSDFSISSKQYQFYGPLDAELKLYQVKAPLLDLTVFSIAVLYVGVLYYICEKLTKLHEE